VTQTRSASVYFLGSDDELPRFDEKIATYSNTKSAFRKIIAHIDACHILTGLSDGLQISGSVSPMTFAHFGNAAGYSMTISTHADLALRLRHRSQRTVLGAFLEGSYPEVIASEFRVSSAPA